MNNDQKKRQIPIKDAKTGAVRFSEPMPMRAPRTQSSEQQAIPAPIGPSPTLVVKSAAFIEPAATGTLSSPPITEEVKTMPFSEALPSADKLASDTDSTRTKPTTTATGKPKADIENLEQFIAYAYSRKGRRVGLDSKVERVLAQNPNLDDAANQRLQALVDADDLMAVPRQLLLLSREIEGFPGLREALKSFVRSVMERHPAYEDSGVRAAMLNQPDAPSVANALRTVAGYSPSDKTGKAKPKPAELQTLRQNAVYLLATWCACNRGFGLEELATLFLQVLWAPASEKLSDENARLRSMTEVADLAAIGLVCQKLRAQVTDARTALELMQNEAGKQRQQLAEVEEQLRLRNAELEARTAELEMLRTASSQALADQRAQREAERMHLQHDLAQLRGRLVRRLEDSTEMLEVGLTALRNRTPRVEVMTERAELVVDALRAELNSLKDE